MKFGDCQNHKISLRVILVFVLILILLFPESMFQSSSFQDTNPTSATSNYFGQNSWASGVMVPNGSIFADGGKLSWAQARNVTAVVELPWINETDGEILAIMSLKTEDGSVLQLAAGIYPGSSVWHGFAWFVTGSTSTTQKYNWVLNASQPTMIAGSSVILSIFQSTNGWSFRLSEQLTGKSVGGLFSLNEVSPIASGDQEVFALESYSYDSSVFESMGNLTLVSLIIDGRTIRGGWYGYSGWDSVHSPLFVVGSTGAPSFISSQFQSNGTVSWSYIHWTGSTLQVPAWAIELIVLILLLCGLLVLAFIIRIGKRNHVQQTVFGHASNLFESVHTCSQMQKFQRSTLRWRDATYDS